MSRLAFALVLGAALPCVADPASPVRLICDKTVAEVGVERVICFRVEATNDADLSLETKSSDAKVLEVVAPGVVVAGEALGAVRVRGIRAGTVELRIGDATMKVTVVTRRVADASALPRISWPLTGTVVWGEIGVGVEIDRDALPEGATVELRLSKKLKLAPVMRTFAANGPTIRFMFTVDASKASQDALDMHAAIVVANVTLGVSEPVVCRVVRPAAGDIVCFEAEAARDDSKRPEGWTKGAPPRGCDGGASGEEYAVVSDPTVLLPLEIPRDGLYQVFVRGRGGLAAGTWPSLDLWLDAGGQAVGTSPLVGDRWHRVPVSTPLALTAGPHVIQIVNGSGAAYGEGSVRTAHVDAFEILRVGDLDVAGTAPQMGGMMKRAGAGPGMRDGSGAHLRPDRVAVAFERPLEGLSVPGDLVVSCLLVWEGSDATSPPPRIVLLLNGTAFAEQVSPTPRFEVNAGAFRPGDNTLQLRAELADGDFALSAVQTMKRPPLEESDGGRPRAYRLFGPLDPAWGEDALKLTEPVEMPLRYRNLVVHDEGPLELRLPAEFVGDFDILLTAGANGFEEVPQVEVTLRGPGGARVAGSGAAPAGLGEISLGTIDLPRGEKTLVFKFPGGKRVEGTDGTVLVTGLLLRGAAAADALEPGVAVIWPPKKADVFGADVVVAEIADDGMLAWADLVVDGRRRHFNVGLAGRAGPVVFPLLLRDLPPGKHKVAVFVVDAAGAQATSPPRYINVLERAPAAPGTFDRAVRLLNRFAYGPDPRELAAVLQMGETAWLRDRLGRGGDDPIERASWEAATAILPVGAYGGDAITTRLLTHALYTSNPARARFVHFVDNHFSTWIRKIGPDLERKEHMSFARLGAAPFRDLLAASSHSPAMLRYLDQEYSFAGALNENYAREVMELHTLGVHGGYSQKDVTTLARILTGWTAASEGGGAGVLVTWFGFEPLVADNREEVFFGIRVASEPPSRRYDRPQLALNFLASHPSTAKFVAKKLIEHYAVVPAPEGFVADIAKVFLETDGDMKEVVCAVAAHPGFRDAPASERVARPIDYALRAARACDAIIPGEIEAYLGASAMAVFDRPTPDGWPEEDAAWTNTNALIQRWRFARDNQETLVTLIPQAWREEEIPAEQGWRQRVIDLLAVRITGGTLSHRSNSAALEALTASEGTREELARAAVVIVMSMPEANLK